MKIPKLKTKHLLSVTDLTRSEIIDLFEFTAKLKKCVKTEKPHRLLKGNILAMIFEKSSTRTRVSFESGIFQLGGTGLFLGKNDIQLGRGEPMKDTARVLSRYVNCIMIRTFEHKKVETLAEYSTVPVINGLTDDYHPCQALADFFTIYEDGKNFKKCKLAFIGDGNNMANSLMLTGAILGCDVAIASPKEYQPQNDVIAKAQDIAQKSGSTISVTESIEEAAQDADYLYTDVWASMGQEEESKIRMEKFKGYAVTMELINKCCPETKVMHCLPAHRGEEIEDAVMESPKHSLIFDEAENRLHIQKAVMATLVAGNKKK